MDAHVKDETLHPKKLSEALVGLRLGLGQDQVCDGTLGPCGLFRASTYPAQVTVVQVSEQLVPMADAKH